MRAVLPLILLPLLFAGCGAPESHLPSLAKSVDCERAVSTGQATYHGKRDAGACVWKGIEFGVPPIDNLRFQYARPSTSVGTVDATAFGNTCIQPGGFKPEWFRTELTYGEDCLNLNVWAPGSSADGNFAQDLPVMVWFYGGGFAVGSANTHLYNGGALAENDVIVVTVNYRLGPLGWLAIPGAQGDGAQALTGNYGLSDQILALEWVRDHIADFGGNPERVTIFGESAGGYSVCALLASPKAAGLFHGAIMQSGGCIMAGPESHTEESLQWIEDAGCPVTAPASLACLRALDAAYVAEELPAPLFKMDAPVIDGVYLHEQPEVLLERDGAPVPVIAGMTADEIKLLGLGNLDVLQKMSEPWSTTWGRIENVLGREAMLALQSLYPEDAYGSPFDMLAALGTDAIFSCPARLAAASAESGWFYRFRIEPDSFFLEPYSGSFHASEVPFVFGGYDVLGMLYLDKSTLGGAMTLSRQIQRYWTNFAKTGNPNGPDLPYWPTYAENGAAMELTRPMSVTENLLKPQCAVIEPLLPRELNERFFTFLPEVAGISF